MKAESFEAKTGYKFRDESLLETALTHRSVAREKGGRSAGNNERLEFLGDAFLDAITGAELYRLLPDEPEGQLTKKRAGIVCESALWEIGNNLDIGSFLNLGPGEEANGGRKKPSIIADAVEAVIGAIFLDGGFDAAREFVLREFKELIENSLAGNDERDSKSALQERLQKNGSVNIEYRLTGTKGPDHDRMFFTEVAVGGRVLGRGSGRTKKEAERVAAKEAMKYLDSAGEEKDVL